MNERKKLGTFRGQHLRHPAPDVWHADRQKKFLPSHRAVAIRGADNANTTVRAIEDVGISGEKSANPMAIFRPRVPSPLKDFTTETARSNDQNPAHVRSQGPWTA